MGAPFDDVVSHAKTGYYALQDYAVKYWFDHVLECIKSDDQTLSLTKIEEVFSSTQRFLRSYGYPEKMGPLLTATNFSVIVEGLEKFLPSDGYERNSCLDLEIRTEIIRRTLANIDVDKLNPEEKTVFINLQGPSDTFKCPKPWCDFFTGGLKSQAERSGHINDHEFPFRCTYKGCIAFTLGFSSSNRLQKHVDNYHVQHQDDDGTTFPDIGVSFKGAAKDDEFKKFLRACTRGDVPDVKRLLESDAIKRQINNHGHNVRHEPTPCALYVAARGGHLKVCDLLISHGALLNIRDHNRRVPLHVAAGNGHVEVCKLLIGKGANLEAAALNKLKTPLHFAAEKGHLEVCNLLISAGANVNGSPVHMRYTCRFKPLDLAVAEGHLKVCELLLSKGADPNAGMPNHEYNHDRKSPLLVASVSGHLDVCRLLVTYGADVNGMDWEDDKPLHAAVKSKHVGVVDFLLRQNDIEANAIDGYDITPVRWAIEVDNSAILDLMLASPKVHVQMDTKILREACHADSPDVVRYLVTNGMANLVDEETVWWVFQTLGYSPHGDDVLQILLSTEIPVLSRVQYLIEGLISKKSMRRLVPLLKYPLWTINNWEEYHDFVTATYALDAKEHSWFLEPLSEFLWRIECDYALPPSKASRHTLHLR